jgi:hypothetical protein
MTFPPQADRWTLAIANEERLETIASFGFTERQARFLVDVLLHAGVFVERQYCRSAGLVHGQKSTDFIRALVDRRFAKPISTGKLHRGRMFHVHYKPLWTAIGEPDSRFRKPAATGRMIERLMLLDAVLDDPACAWLGPARDKRRHFMRQLGDRLERELYPQLSFGDGPARQVRFFPDKLPIGVHGETDRHVFTYLVTHPSPMDFRMFLLRHALMFQRLYRWTVRLLIPRQLRRSRLMYLHAARESLAMGLSPSAEAHLEFLFTERKRLATPGAETPDERYLKISSVYRLPKYRALYRQWLQEPVHTIRLASSTLLADAVERGEGTIECVDLTRQYLHLSPLVDIA